MRYKVGDIVLVRSGAGPGIPRFHVKLIERIKRKPAKDPEYIIWRSHLTKPREADILRKEWHIQFEFPDQIETFVYETDIIKKVKNVKRRNKKRKIRE
tara:strand:+ start:2235 stop:2528 length:294 start_codon:yes stop_codon:yes gene_type:complete